MRGKFVRSQLGKLKKLKEVWRRPRGRHNKLRLGKKNRGPKPAIGYKRSKEPAAQRIFCPKDAGSVSGGKAVIGAGVGKRKRAEIAKECEKMNISLKNPPAKVRPKAKKETKKE